MEWEPLPQRHRKRHKSSEPFPGSEINDLITLRSQEQSEIATLGDKDGCRGEFYECKLILFSIIELFHPFLLNNSLKFIKIHEITRFGSHSGCAVARVGKLLRASLRPHRSVFIQLHDRSQ
jgi:hypothetical protein